MMAAIELWRFKPLLWLGLAVLILGGDFFTGPTIQFPILCLVPIALAAAYSGRLWGLLLAVGMPIVLLGLRARWEGDVLTLPALVNAGIRIAVLVTFAILVEAAVRARALSREIRILRGILPICSICNRIRTKSDNWVRVDAYITEHSEAKFSHGLCAECMRAHYPELQATHVPKQPVAEGSGGGAPPDAPSADRGPAASAGKE
jgi:hypothetical protein